MLVMAKRVAKRTKTNRAESAEERLFAYLGDPALSDEELGRLRGQIEPAQLSGALWSMGKQLFAEELHHACQARLPEYVRLEASGQDAEVMYPRVKAHLAECERCSKAYDALAQAASMPLAPVPSSVTRAPSPDEPSIWERVTAGKGVLRLFTEIRIRVRRGLASFGELPSPLAPAHIALPAMRGARDKPDGAETRAHVLPLVSAEHDIAISLTIGPVSDGRASLTVQVMRSSSGQPLAGVRVALRDEARRLLASERTQADGRTTFSHIGSGRYMIEVKQAGSAWELPLAFTWQD
jgi:hypothetical protein